MRLCHESSREACGSGLRGVRVRVRDRGRVRVRGRDRDRDRVRDRVRVRRLGVLLKVDAHGPLAEVDEQVHRQRGHADACMG